MSCKLKKTVQQLINQDKQEEFKMLCKDPSPILVRVLHSSRYPNFMELSLLHDHDIFADCILKVLKNHTTQTEYKMFLKNHHSLDKARLDRLTQDPAEEITHRLAKTSILLQKAMAISPAKMSPPPLFYSSSESSESCFSTRDHHWTPPVSPIVNISTPKLSSTKRVRFDPQAIILNCCVSGDRKELLDCMREVDVKEMCDGQNRSLLQVALLHGNEHLVDDLLHKVDVNQRDLDGWTCLHYAAALERWKSLEKLVSEPTCDLQVKTGHGLKIEECPHSNIGKRKCKSIVDKARKTNCT